MQFWRRRKQDLDADSDFSSGLGGAPRASYELRDDPETDRKHGGKGTTGPSRYSGTTRTLESSHFAGRSLPTTLDELEAFEAWRAKHPCILQQLHEITALLKGKRLAVFLDYDGTLTPIVSNPDEAILSEQMRDVVRNLATQFPTAIISGRGREKVENFVKLRELYYAGSHGMDIAGPTELQGGKPGMDSTFQPAAHFRPLIDEVYRELCQRLEHIPGSSVEHNNFCVSAHFRNCQGESWEQVVQAAEDVVAQRSELCLTRGRKVVEVRPKVNWNKGTALLHLLSVLGLKAKPDVVSIYIGDDHTDEDAFKALRDTQQGFGVLVTTKVKDTAARYTVREPGEVQQFLAALVAWAQCPDNGWHAWGACQGWAPQPQQQQQQQQLGQAMGGSDAGTNLDGSATVAHVGHGEGPRRESSVAASAAAAAAAFAGTGRRGSKESGLSGGAGAPGSLSLSPATSSRSGASPAASPRPILSGGRLSADRRSMDSTGAGGGSGPPSQGPGSCSRPGSILGGSQGPPSSCSLTEAMSGGEGGGHGAASGPRVSPFAHHDKLVAGSGGLLGLMSGGPGSGALSEGAAPRSGSIGARAGSFAAAAAAKAAAMLFGGDKPAAPAAESAGGE